MKPSKALLPFLAAFAVSSSTLHAATPIQLDLATNNAGAISLDAGDNTFSFTGFAVDYLIVGGGGGGGGGTNHGSNSGGGGGAGGLREGSTSIGGLQNIVIGGGGAGGNNARGTTGQNSTALGFTSLGGGGGGFYGGNGLDGGSGGGAGARGTYPDGTNVNGGLAVGGAGSLGHAGGSRLNTSTVASGGGGAGGAGANGGTGTGGAGVTRNITGADLLYARGGSGTSGIVGTNNTGGGGGGAGTAATTGAVGGSGIVVVRYTGSQVLSGGIVSTVGGDTVHQFLGSSTLDLHSATIAGDISGDGNLVWDKTGTLTLGGTNTYGGTTSITSGILKFNSSADQTLGGAISGTGALVKDNSGTLTLTNANNTYSGGTTISSGTLTFLETGSKSSSGTHAFAGGTTLGLGVSGSSGFTSTDITNAFAGTMSGNLTGITVATTTNVGIDTSNGNFAHSDDITGDPTKGLVKLGVNTLTLSGSNTYTGGTNITAGTLELTVADAAGSGGITLSGANAANLELSGLTITNDITFSNTNAASNVMSTVAASGAFTTGTSGDLKGSFVGGTPDTTAQILDGTSSTGGVLSMSFAPSSTAINESARRSDVFNIAGTATDTYVIQILVNNGLASDSFLAFWDQNVTNSWVAAGSNFIADAYDSTNHFTVGNYGFDSVSSSVWAVVNYGGSFTAIPEPSTALAGILLGLGLLRRRRA